MMENEVNADIKALIEFEVNDNPSLTFSLIHEKPNMNIELGLKMDEKESSVNLKLELDI